MSVAMTSQGVAVVPGLARGDVPEGAAWIALRAEEVVRALSGEGG